ncbi:hypothetical protein B0H19DRAFT_1247155 [Mycena capillaripes]|nr:hypothetical protein B0H19DRAFT_1247155 [Mycena capillaripes]
MLPFFTTIAAAIFLISVNIATSQDSSGLSAEQECMIGCSIGAANASGCDLYVLTFDAIYISLTFPPQQTIRAATAKGGGGVART